ncbi:hypothetical protein ACLB2K_002005 [Fragaria x ananassa]
MAFGKIKVANPIVEMDVRIELHSPPSGADDGAPPPQQTLAASPITFPPRRVRRIPVFWRDHPKLQIKSISPESSNKVDLAGDRRGGKVIGDAARVCWGEGAPLSAPDGGKRSFVRTTDVRSTSFPCWTKAICIGRHAFGDQYRAGDLVIKGPGKLKLLFDGKDEKTELEVYNFTGEGGVALATCNIDESIHAFAEASMTTAYEKKWPLYLSTKNTVLKKYDGRAPSFLRQASLQPLERPRRLDLRLGDLIEISVCRKRRSGAGRRSGAVWSSDSNPKSSPREKDGGS